MPAFKLDENLPVEAATILRAAGYDAHTVLEERLNGESDRAVARECQQEHRALLTLDLDFADIRLYPPRDYAGLIVLRLSTQDKQHVLEVIRRLLVLFKQSDVEARLWIVDDHSVRVRE